MNKTSGIWGVTWEPWAEDKDESDKTPNVSTTEKGRRQRSGGGMR